MVVMEARESGPGPALGGRSSMLSNNNLLVISNSNKSKINHSNNSNK